MSSKETDQAAKAELLPQLRRRAIVAAAAGNFVEWYDAGIYGIAATVLATQLFPKSVNPAVALLSTYAIFAISYLLRPFGGLVFGRMADKYGRKGALSITIVFTSIATGLIGLIPTYTAIGIAAPVILLLLRLVQSMGTGGEYVTAISFVYEHGARGHKATAVASMTSLTFLGFFVGAGLSTLFTLFPGDGYEVYGWRILFLVAIPFGLVGLYLRRRTVEGSEFQALQKERHSRGVDAAPISEAFGGHWTRMLAITVFMAIWAVYATMITNYLPTFLKANKSLTPTQANAANLVSSAAIIVFILALSPFADKIGLLKSILIGTGAVAVFTIPGFLIAANGTAGGFIGAAILGGCKGVLAIPLLLSVGQLFPPSIRATAGGFAYNIATSVIGGTAPFVAVWLNDVTGTEIAFSLYVIFFALVSFVIGATLARKWIAESAVHSGDVGVRAAVGS